jgi:hypothetical protein
MDIITADFETFYDRQYSLSRLTTEEYIRDKRFQVIGVSVKVNEDPPEWFSGTARGTIEWLHGFDWEHSALVAHNTMFDAAILSWRCGIKPARLIDTLSMSRAMFGVDAGHSLKALAQRLHLPSKGDEVTRAIGKRRLDFTPQELADYAEYCKLDVHLTYEAFRRMVERGFPKQELQLIDATLRMFTDPVLELDGPLLEGHLINTQRQKQKLLDDAGAADKKDLMSNNKFADMLRELEVEPPMKTSPTTGKETYAFAKTDEAFRELEDHEDPRVQALVSARLGNKSTLEETRTQRFIDMAKRGKFPVPLYYYGAHTGRWSGRDKVNLQNLPSRGPNAKKIKQGIVAPDGHMLIDCDSAQIEARVLAWLAEQEDLVQAFRNKEDVYKIMASNIYGTRVDEIDKGQRQVGKVVILGAGYGVGHVKLQAFLKMQAGVDVPLDEAKRIIDVYRHTNDRISGLWRQAQSMLKGLLHGDKYQVGRPGVLEVVPDEHGIRLPSGLFIRYNGLYAEEGEKGLEMFYKTRKGPSRIYGGKNVENLSQALARCIIGEQLLKINKRYRVVLTVHDSIVSCVPEDQVDEARDYIETCMRWTPDWAEGLPVDCESGVGKSYGACE